MRMVSIDGRIIVSQPAKAPRHWTDIALWAQAFSIFKLVLISYVPAPALDLTRYMLLILQTHAQFGGPTWYYYDEAFCKDAAAKNLQDWSSMNVELYNFHTSASSRFAPVSSRVAPQSPLPHRESIGAQSGSTLCRSWNAGRCVASRAMCRYLHVCDVPRCHGNHRRIACPTRSFSTPTSTSTPQLALPGSAGSHRS